MSTAKPVSTFMTTSTAVRAVRLLLVTILSCGVSQVWAQDAGSLLREQQRQQELQRQQALPQADESRDQTVPLVAPEAGETIRVRELVFTGKVELLSAEQRAQFAASVSGKRLGINGIRALADVVTAELQQQGHLLAGAILPPQDITDGVVTLEIVEGRLDKTIFERGDGVRMDQERLHSLVDKIDDKPATKQHLEEELLRINDYPGITARARLTPGESPNTSNLIINLEQAPLFSMNVGSDNFGSYTTGEEQLNASAALTDVSGYGDLTQLSVVSSEGQTYASAAFNAPVGMSGLTAKATYGYLDYDNIDDIGSILELEGYAHFAGLGLDYSLIRSRNVNLRLNGGVNWKALVDDSIGGRLQDKRSFSGTLGLSGDARDTLSGGGLTYWSAAWTYGDLDLSGEASALAIDQLTLRTQGHFQRVNVSLARLQSLPGDFSLYARMYGQWANKNLDSSETFSLGGPYGVRGWPVGEASGDMGALGTVELRYDVPLAAQWGQLQLATFVDGGHVWVNKNVRAAAPGIDCGCNDYGLASAGVSARWSHQFFTVSASYAQGLGNNPGRSAVAGTYADNTTDTHRFWLTGTARF